MIERVRHIPGTALAILAAVAVQALFFAADDRPPRDPMDLALGLYPIAERLSDAPASALPLAITEEGGWYHLLVGAALAVHRAPWVLETVLLSMLALALAAVAGITGRIADERAATAAVLLAIGAPPVLLFARQYWIHYPEAALALCLGWVVAADPRLQRVRSALIAALIGVLLVRLRPSGLVLVGVALPALILAPWRRPTPGVLGVAAVWAAASVWTLSEIGAYLAVKSPTGWLQEMPFAWLVEQIPQTLGYAPGLVILAGLALWARHAWAARGGLTPDQRVVVALLAGWAVVPLLLMLRFRAGSHDFTFWAPVLAIVAGIGLARQRLVALAALPAAYALLLPWIPAPAHDVAVAAWAPHDLPAPLDLTAPRQDWGATPVQAALDAACPPGGRRSCHVIAPSGLFYPLRNDDLGKLELLLLGEDRVELRGLGDHPRKGWAAWRVDAMAAWDCGDADLWGLEKYPDLLIRTVDTAAELDLRPVLAIDVGECTWHWLVPNGELRAPEALPDSTGRAWDPEGLRARNEAWLDAHPQDRGRTHLPRVQRAAPPAGPQRGRGGPRRAP